MSELHDNLANAAGSPRADLDLSALHARAATRARHRRAVRAAGVVGGALAIVFATAFAFAAGHMTTSVDKTTSTTTVSAVVAKPGWTKLPAAPIAARRDAVSVWTGKEVLVFGGFTSPSAPTCDGAVIPLPTCTPFQQWVGARGSASDGAAYDPATNTWRPIAPLPKDFAAAESSGASSPGRSRGKQVQVLDDKVYVLGWNVSSPSVAALAVYDPATDHWSNPQSIDAASKAGWALTTFGHDLVAYAPEHTANRVPDRLFDPSTGRWSTLTNDPIGSTHSRRMIGVGGDLFELSGATSGSGKSELLVGHYDGRHWRLASHPVRYPIDGTWIHTGRKFLLMNAFQWAYPYGQREMPRLGLGVSFLTFDPETGTVGVEDPPKDVVQGTTGTGAAGVADGHSFAIVSSRGIALFEPSSGSWSRIDSPLPPSLQGFSGTWADNRVVVWGGAYGPERKPPTSLSGQGWIWTPPRPGTSTSTTTAQTTSTGPGTSTTLPAGPTGS